VAPLSVEPALQQAVNLVREALTAIQKVHVTPTKELTARPALLLFGFVAAAVYLLEHANWAVKYNEPSWESDVEVFLRWVLEDGFRQALDALLRASHANEEKSRMDRRIVFERDAGRTKL
jgi:hypothetical protein